MATNKKKTDKKLNMEKVKPVAEEELTAEKKDRKNKVAAKIAGNKISEKLEEKLGDKVSPELKNALKGLFNR